MAKSSRLGLLVASLLAAGCGGSPSSDIQNGDAGAPSPPAVGPRAARDVLNVMRGFTVRRATGSDFQNGPEIGALIPAKAATLGPVLGLIQSGHVAFPAGDLVADPVLRDAEAEGIDVADRMLVPRLPVWTLRGLNHRANVALPRRSTGALSLADADSKVTIEATMEGVADVPAEVVEGYVVYAGATQGGGHVVHRPTAEGTEDFVYLPSAGTKNLRHVVSLGKNVAGLRLVSNTLEFLDVGGTPRLRVAPPYLVDSNGVRLDAVIKVDGCRYDSDPRAPWGRPVTTPGAASCGVRVVWNGESLVYPILVDPAWTTTGSMIVARENHTATLLGSGKVLIAGGYESGGGNPISSAELFDGAGTFAATGSLGTARGYHTATLLGSGKVLIAGGDTVVVSGLSTAETFDGTGTFAPTGSMTIGRSLHTATLLGSGKVLIAGGFASTVFRSSAELFDGATFTSTGAMAGARAGHTATLLGSGKVLVAGGVNGPASTAVLSTAELFDGATFSAAGSMTVSRTFHTATLLGSGKVLIAGGYESGGGGPSYAEVFDGTSFVATGSMITARSSHTATLLGSGKVLITGGGLSSAELFDSTSFVPGGTMTTVRWWSTATLLASGAVLVTGGSGGPSGILSSAELFAQSVLGAACGSPVDCLSNFCADGVCCDSACTGSCSSCNQTSFIGSCRPVASGPPAAGRTCAPYSSCAAGSCSTTCTTDPDCTTGNYCAAPSCVPKLAAGLSCSASNQCLSGFCVDGVCCTSSCTDQCAACNVSTSLGTCSPVTGAVHGSRTACDKAGTTCGATCNGTDTTACHYPPTSTTCSSNACASGTETHASFCDGSGTCNDVPKACGAYQCGTTACKSACASPTDCATGFTCTSNVCVPSTTSKLGDPCTDASTCPSGAFCTDGVCCAVIGCSSGSSCSVNKKGTCAKLGGTSCTSGLECGSGFCADGVCCDRACDGQCEACDHAGSFGTCTSIIGTPHGTRTKCDAGTTTCAAKTCDGKDGTTCAAFVGTETSCGAASCSSATFTAASTCDGSGNCKAPSPQACAPYGCTTTGCGSSCTAPTDCAPGFTCTSNVCVPSGSAAVCSADGLSSVAKDTGIATPCAPYKCAGDGRCGTSCGTSDDCAAGYNCDTNSKNCVQAAATSTASSGGCSVDNREGSSGVAAVGILTGLMALGRVRRRSRTAA